MPATHVALLRGINVGKAKRVAMADLRAVVEGLGYTDVRTLLNSGNVVFTAPAGAKGDPGPRIERAVRERLGVSSRVVVVTAREWKTILAGNPLATPGRHPSRLMVAVLADPRDRAQLAAAGRAPMGSRRAGARATRGLRLVYGRAPRQPAVCRTRARPEGRRNEPQLGDLSQTRRARSTGRETWRLTCCAARAGRSR